MATSTEDAVDPTKVEEESKDTLEADKTVADEQKDDTTPAATSDAVADDAVKSKDEASAPEGPESDRTLSPAPTLGTILSITIRQAVLCVCGVCPCQWLSNQVSKGMQSDPVCCQTIVI